MRWGRPARSGVPGIRFRGDAGSGKGMECLDYLQPGNVLMVADLARLGRSTAYLADIVTVLGQPGDRVPVPGLAVA